MSLYEAKPAIPKELQEGEGGRRERSQFERTMMYIEKEEGKRKWRERRRKLGQGFDSMSLPIPPIAPLLFPNATVLTLLCL